MNSTGAREKKYSSRESQLVSESFEFLSSEEQEDIDNEPGCSKCIGIDDEGTPVEEKQHGEKVKHFVQMRDGKTTRCRKRTAAKETKTQSCRSGIVGLQSLHDDAISENSVSNAVERIPASAHNAVEQIPSGHERNYSSRESQFVTETFSFLTMDDVTDDIVTTSTSLAADDLMNRTESCDVRSPPLKHSSRESQFITESFQFLSSGDVDNVFKSGMECAFGEPALAEVQQLMPAKTYSSRESEITSESFEFLDSDENEDNSETDSIPVSVSILGKHNDTCNGCTSQDDMKSLLRRKSQKGCMRNLESTNPLCGRIVDQGNSTCSDCTSQGADTKSLLRRKSQKGYVRKLESTNSSQDPFGNQTENDIIMLALKRVGEFSESDKFLVHFECEDGEERQSVDCDSELQRCHSSEECSYSYSDDSDKSTEDNVSARTSSEISDGGVNAMTTDTDTARVVKQSDSTSTTSSEAEFQGMHGSIRKRLVRRQSALCTYQRRTAGVEEVEKVVTVIKEHGDAGFGFHLFGSAPVVISTIEPGSCAARAGLNVGDALVTIDGKHIAAASVEEVIEIIKQNPDKVTLGLRQDSLPLDRTLCCGYLTKQGGKGVFKNWKRRWLELKADHCLYYFKTQQDTDPVGAIVLSGYTVTRAPEINRQHTFKLYKYGQRTYYFQADSSQQMNRWAGALANMAATTTKMDSWLDVSTHNVGLAALTIKDPECHGFLTKLGGRVKNWKRRYCVLKDACLYYYIEVNSHTAQGIAHLHGYYVLETSRHGKKFGFTLIAPETKMRTFHFYAENQTDYTRWINAMKSSIGKWVREEDPSLS